MREDILETLMGAAEFARWSRENGDLHPLASDIVHVARISRSGRLAGDVRGDNGDKRSWLAQPDKHSHTVFGGFYLRPFFECASLLAYKTFGLTESILGTHSQVATSVLIISARIYALLRRFCRFVTPGGEKPTSCQHRGPCEIIPGVKEFKSATLVKAVQR